MVPDKEPEPYNYREHKKKKVYHRPCLGEDCDKMVKTRHKFIRLCDACKVSFKYKMGW